MFGIQLTLVAIQWRVERHYTLVVEHVHRLARVGVGGGPGAVVGREEDGVVAGAAQASQVGPGGLPVVDALAAALGHLADDVDDLVHPVDLAVDADGDGRLAEVGHGAPLAGAQDGVVGLDDLDGLLVLARHGGQALLEVLEGGGGAVEGVEGEAEDVPVGRRHDARVGEGAEPRLLQRHVPAVVDVDHDVGLVHAAGHGVVDAAACRRVDGGQACEVLRARAVPERVDLDVAERPDHAVANLVAERDDGEVDARVLERVQRRVDVAADRLGQLRQRLRPGRRGVVVLRIGPRVGEVVVEVDVVALAREALGEVEHVRKVVLARDGVDPKSISCQLGLSY